MPLFFPDTLKNLNHFKIYFLSDINNFILVSNIMVLSLSSCSCVLHAFPERFPLTTNTNFTLNNEHLRDARSHDERFSLTSRSSYSDTLKCRQCRRCIPVNDIILFDSWCVSTVCRCLLIAELRRMMTDHVSSCSHLIDMFLPIFMIGIISGR